MTVVRSAWLILCSFLSRNGEENLSCTYLHGLYESAPPIYVQICTMFVHVLFKGGWYGFGFGRLGTGACKYALTFNQYCWLSKAGG
jgi:hypothetical protein